MPILPGGGQFVQAHGMSWGDPGSGGNSIHFDAGGIIVDAPNGLMHVGGKAISDALAFGADPTGVTDSAAAIQAAINALPLTGGTVLLPAGTYKCNSTINIGNGSQSALSTRQNVVLQGVGSAIGWSLIASGATTYGPTRLVSGAAVSLIKINGPLHGWGVQDLFLDGNAIGTVGLDELACSGGDCRNVSIVNFTSIGQYTHALSATGALLNFSPNHSRNFYRNMTIGVPIINGANGIYVDGDSAVSGVNDSWGDEWDMLTIQFISPPVASSGIFTTGVNLVVCDSQLFRNVVFKSAGAPSGAANYAIKFNYSNTFAYAAPVSCSFDQVDFGTSDAVVISAGTPTGAASTAANRIYNIRTVNGVPSNPVNPLIPNLQWENVNAKASAPTTSDVPQGSSSIWKNTTSGAVALWINDAGVMKSVALV